MCVCMHILYVYDMLTVYNEVQVKVKKKKSTEVASVTQKNRRAALTI